MKLFKVIILALLPVFAYSQDSFVKDSIWFYTDLNQCDSVVWWVGYQVKLRGKVVSLDAKPVGWDEKNPCANIRGKDTATLVNFYANPLIDYGRQQAEKAVGFIFQNRNLKSFTGVNAALVRFGMPNMLRQIERTFADSLVGSYILVRPGVNNANVNVTKVANGSVRIRINAQTIFPFTVYSDRWILVQDIAGTGQHVDLYQIEPGRWVSLLGNYGLYKNVRQVVSRNVK